MKMPGWKPKVFTSPCFLWLLVLVGAIWAPANGQSSALTECTRAFYSGDNALAVQLAEKHLSKYPKDVAVRVVLARAKLAQGKPLQAFDELQRALEFDAKNIDASITWPLSPKNFRTANMSGYSRWLPTPSARTNFSPKLL